ncbi:MAG: ADP-ribosylglycohydrolase family protein [Dysgonamonadaceae bacterium]|jgi:ADP-ribosylglycohydrolase|nr:ADP-ribosylglycohydrolase family protein [Dysgonamonadaceae bacterium]
MNRETKYKGSIKLSAIGDALGWMTEFGKSPESLKEQFGTEQIDAFYNWNKNTGGRFYGYTDAIKAGSYSDDTQLFLSVARSIKKGGAVDNDYFAKIELVNWLDYARGAGRTVKKSADKIQRKSAKWHSNFYTCNLNGETFDYKQSGANGAAMRVLPIALANSGNPEKIKEEIFCNSIVTHGHPRAIAGAMLYGDAVDQIITCRPENFSWEDYLLLFGSDLTKKFDLARFNRFEIKGWLKEWNKSAGIAFENLYRETLTETDKQLQLIYKSLKDNWPVNETLSKLGCFDKATKSSGTSTVVAGIYFALKFHKEPLKSILEPVNALGSDTDTIAAFAGGISGALHGQNIIPDKWKTVQDMEYLDKISERLLEISENRFAGAVTPKHADNPIKSLNHIRSDNYSLDEEITFDPLGKGRIISIDRQDTLVKGKYNLLIGVALESGQSIYLSNLMRKE